MHFSANGNHNILVHLFSTVLDIKKYCKYSVLKRVSERELLNRRAMPQLRRNIRAVLVCSHGK